MDNRGCKQLVISGIIWLFFPFILMIILHIVSGEMNGFTFFTNFLVGNLSIMFTAAAISGLEGLKDIVNLITNPFNKKDDVFKNTTSKENRTGKYGRSAVPISLILFYMGSLVTCLTSGNGFYSSRITFTYLILGLMWGVFVYVLFQKGYFEHDDF